MPVNSSHRPMPGQIQKRPENTLAASICRNRQLGCPKSRNLSSPSRATGFSDVVIPCCKLHPARRQCLHCDCQFLFFLVLLFPLFNSTFIPIALRLLLLACAFGWQTDMLAYDETLPTEIVARDYLVQNWQADEGLPRNSINSIAQDQRGYLWLGTPNGVIRFDGVKFVAFESKAAPDMAQGSVRQVYCDDAGALWIGTLRAGLFRFEDGVFLSTKRGAIPAGAAIDSLVQDGLGKLWMTGGDGALGNLETNTFTLTTQLSQIAKGPMLFKLSTDINRGLWFYKQDTYGQLVAGHPTNYTTYPDAVITLAPSHGGGMWLSTGFELRRLSPGQAVTTNIVAVLPFGNYGVSALYEDRSGTLWLGTSRDGLFRLKDGNLEKVEGVHHRISDIFEDAEGNLWVGTDGAGLFKLRSRVFRLVGATEGLARESVVSVSEDWVAPNGGGLGKLTPSGRVEMVNGLEKNSLSSVLDDGTGGVWLGSTSGRLIHRTLEGKNQAAVEVPERPQLRVLQRDRIGNLWIGAFPHGLFLLPAGEPRRLQNLSEQGFSKSAVTAIAEDGKGIVWIGTSVGELHRYEAGKFSKFDGPEGLPKYPISALLPTEDGALWVGTLGGGLGRFQEGKARFLGAALGLIDDVITQLIKDKQGWLWIGSSRGIARTRGAELLAVLEGQKTKPVTIRFGRADGLVNIQCVAEHQPSVWKTKSGELQFATSKGVVAFDPEAIPVNIHPPPLVLESVLVDGLPVVNQKQIKLLHDYKKIEFRYTATSFVAPENVMFRRRLAGFDEDWVEDGNMRSATYPRLRPGHYTFLFTACNNDGVWNTEPFRMTFEVIPAFWQTASFRVGAVILFAGLVGGAARYVTRRKMRRKLARLEQAHALERERTRISRDLHDDLGARLTQMAFLTDLAAVEDGQSKEIRNQLRDVSQQARSAVQSLDETVWMVNPQKDTLPHLIAYLATYAEQFFQPTAINCRQEICRNPPVSALPGNLRRDIFFLVKEALNNVLKHSEAKEVWIRIAVRGPVMRIVIQDDGRGFLLSETKSHRHGLENLRQRAAAAGIGLRLRSAQGQGTRLTLRAILPPSEKSKRTSFLGSPR